MRLNADFFSSIPIEERRKFHREFDAFLSIERARKRGLSTLLLKSTTGARRRLELNPDKSHCDFPPNGENDLIGEIKLGGGRFGGCVLEKNGAILGLKSGVDPLEGNFYFFQENDFFVGVSLREFNLRLRKSLQCV